VSNLTRKINNYLDTKEQFKEDLGLLLLFLLTSY